MDVCLYMCVHMCAHGSNQQLQKSAGQLSLHKPKIQPFMGQDLNIKNLYSVLGCTPGFPESTFSPTSTVLLY